MAGQPLTFIHYAVAMLLLMSVGISWCITSKKKRWPLLLASVIVAIQTAMVTDGRSFIALSLWLFFFLAIPLTSTVRWHVYLYVAVLLGLNQTVCLCAFLVHYHQFTTPHFGERCSGLYGRHHRNSRIGRRFARSAHPFWITSALPIRSVSTGTP